jgi:fumarylacetoacetate (FAA) hydrolase
MKLATLKDSTRDGKLVVVSKDLTRCTEVGHIARTLQAALDDWAHVAPRLQLVADGLETGAQPAVRFHEHDAAAPLPRGVDWITPSSTGNGVVSHGGNGFMAARDAISSLGGQLHMRGGVAAILGDMAAGPDIETARSSVLLLLLVNEVASDASQAGTPAFSPVAVTPDELGDTFSGGKVHLNLKVDVDGKAYARVSAGGDHVADFASLAMQAARTKPLCTGTIIATGPIVDPAQAQGNSVTPALATGSIVRVEMKDRQGHSIFGAIEQTVG